MSVLPPKLEHWNEEMRSSPSQEIAMKVIAEYFSFFGRTKVNEELWLLVSGTLTNEEIHHCQQAKGRHDLLFFFDFTKMMLDAAHYLYAQKKT